jgi:hypothetical protein
MRKIKPNDGSKIAPVAKSNNSNPVRKHEWKKFKHRGQ